MEILYQIPGDIAAGPLGAAELERRRMILQDWAPEGVHVQVADSPGGPCSIESEADEVHCVPAMLAALRGRTVPDAVIVGCFGDPGLTALREVLDCPVVGPFESSLLLGLQLGRRVGVITILDSVLSLLDRVVHASGQSVRYAGALAIDIPVLELSKDVHEVTRRAVAAGMELVATRQADVVVLGCMSLAFLGITDQLSAALGVPVINPARCALATARSLAAQRPLQSRRTYAKPLLTGI